MAAASGAKSRFDGKSYYEALGVSRDATPEQIRRAYLVLARKVHPDVSGGDAQSNADFQTLLRIYTTLSDPARRSAYDRTGSDEDVTDAYKAAYEHWRAQFPAPTEEDIEAFAADYRGSPREREDLIFFFTEFKGDMFKVMTHMPLSRHADIPRFCAALDALIAEKKLRSFAKYRATRDRVTPADLMEDGAEAEEAAAAAKELGLGGRDGGAPSKKDLESAIALRMKERADTFMAAFESKYAAIDQRERGGGEGKRKRRKQEGAESDAPPSEEEFRRVQAEMLARAGAPKGGREKAKGKGKAEAEEEEGEEEGGEEEDAEAEEVPARVAGRGRGRGRGRGAKRGGRA
jgi:DnaJ family protein C protein 9